MRVSSIFLLLIPVLAAQAQDLSFQPIGNRPTRAVVVGISEYQDEGIKDLGYAHRDAEVFAEFLKSPAGGSLKPSEIRLLTNENATLSRIQSALLWLVKKAGKGDQAIFYFAGHGDVETKGDKEKGYLLAYDTPYNNYALNALSLDYLNQETVGQLSAKGAKVIVITDACHSGALAGQEAQGRESTAAELMKRFEDEVRIMSCQPYELSREGSEWGEGRGVFSYYLVQGLKGWADKDPEDERVDLYELENYLQEEVRQNTRREQHPDIFGGKKEEPLFWVDEATMAELRASGREEVERDIEEDFIGGNLLSKEERNTYYAFRDALQKGWLMSPPGRSAADYYAMLDANPTFNPIKGIMNEYFYVPLMDSVQQAVNAYLSADPGELAQRARYDRKYERFRAYLQRAVTLLGANDPRYRPTLAKQYYFEGLVLRLEGEQEGKSDSLYRLALGKQELALEQEGRAAYIHNELGLLHLQLGELDKGMEHLQKATEISPTWAIPYNNLAIIYRAQGQAEQAEEHYRKAIRYKPDFASAYTNLGNLLSDQGRDSAAEQMFRRGIELGPGYKSSYFNLGLFLSYFEDEESIAEAKSLFQKALQLDPGYPEALFELGNLYNDALGQPDSAEAMYRQAILVKPDYADAYQNYGVLLYAEGRPDSAELLFREVIRLDEASPAAYTMLGMLFAGQGQWEKVNGLLRSSPFDTTQWNEIYVGLGYTAFQFFPFEQAADIALKAFKTAAGLQPGDPGNFYLICSIHTLLGQVEEGLDYLEATLEKAQAVGEDYYDQIREDVDLDALRGNPRYEEAMQQYFPERQD